MKPSYHTKLARTSRQIVYRRVLGWWPDRNETKPLDGNFWWGPWKGELRYGKVQYVKG